MLSMTSMTASFANGYRTVRSIQVKSDLNVNARMRTEIDLNKREHFLKAN